MINRHRPIKSKLFFLLFSIFLPVWRWKSDARFEEIISWATHYLGDDKNGYRKEILGLLPGMSVIPDFSAEK